MQGGILKKTLTRWKSGRGEYRGLAEGCKGSGGVVCLQLEFEAVNTK
jgi:hypothetical protein